MNELRELTNCDTHRIELYDNSHISGEYAVGAMVVYIDGATSKKDYRLYRVHNRNNDYANMQEVLQALGVTPYRSKHIMKQIRNIPADALQARYQHCVDANFDITSGRVNERAALNALMLKLVVPGNATKQAYYPSKR